MPYVISCPHCKQQMQMADDAAGKQFRCPFCKNGFVAPARPTSGVVPHPAAAPAPPKPPAPAAPPKPTTPQVSTAPTAAGTAVGGKSGGVPKPAKCPACSAPLNEGAVSCMDCGFLVQSEAAADTEGAPAICPNVSCGVANPPTERYCQRCSTLLPISPGIMIHGRYKIRKLLAMGGFGAVYLAEDTKNAGREVAIKEMICADPAEFPIRLNFFRREAEVLRLLASSPIVPRFNDLIEQDKTALLIMEFIPGKDLQKILDANNHQPFPYEQVLDWGKSICDVLQLMHASNPPVVYRDLKPENIMLRPDNRSIAMIDFGTARDLGKTVKEQMKAKTKVYTEGYAPPEQIIGKPEPRSDLFALAGTLYQLVTGREPEGSFTAREIDAKLQEPNGVPAQQRWLFELIRTNLAEDVHDRYHTAREFKADLEKKQLTREVNCPKCGAANKAREPYCVKCAEALTDPTPACHQCGGVNRMGSRCCIHCGNRLR